MKTPLLITQALVIYSSLHLFASQSIATHEPFSLSNSTTIEDKKQNTPIECNYENCPLLQGVCFRGKCLCARGFVTHNEVQSELIFCNYKQKSHLVAFFLEFFFPVGAGHLYAEKTISAFIKFGLFLIFCCGLCGEICCLSAKANKWIIYSSILILADFTLWVLIHAVDIICYALGYYHDGNGVEMI